MISFLRERCTVRNRRTRRRWYKQYRSGLDDIRDSSVVVVSDGKAANMSAKKLIQPTLPFKLVNKPGDDIGTNTRKRKLCGSSTIETRTVNPKVELLNGGTKCFIKSDDQNRNNSQVITITGGCYPTLHCIAFNLNAALGKSIKSKTCQFKCKVIR